MQASGNKVVNEMFEANLPESFIRPNDSDTYALEQFIRAKYERKLYRKKGDSKDSQSSKPSESRPAPSPVKPRTSTPSAAASKAPAARAAPAVDLLSFDDTAAHNNVDFGGFHSAPKPSDTSDFGGFTGFSGSNSNNTAAGGFTAFTGSNTAASASSVESAFFSTPNTTVSAPAAPAAVSKQAILGLYNSGPQGMMRSAPAVLSGGTGGYAPASMPHQHQQPHMMFPQSAPTYANPMVPIAMPALNPGMQAMNPMGYGGVGAPGGFVGQVPLGHHVPPATAGYAQQSPYMNPAARRW